VNTVKVILEKHHYFPQKYYFIDSYAGPGYNEEEQCDGSPIIFLKTAKMLGIDYYAWFVEQDTKSVRELRGRIKEYSNCEVSPLIIPKPCPQ
jgi:hypothetical protein